MIYELLVMLAVGMGGASLALLFGAKQFWLTLPFGLVAVITLRTLSFAILNAFSLASFSALAFYLLLVAAVLVAVYRFKTALLQAALLSVGSAVLAWLIGRVFALKPLGHSDSTWILLMSRIFEKGQDTSWLYQKVPFKRGFDYPLMLSLGPADEYLGAFTPYIFLAIIAAVIWASSLLLNQTSRNLRIFYGGLIAVAFLTTPIVLRSVAYINGHTLTALGVVLIAVTSLVAVRDQKLDRAALILACLSVAVVSTTRPEGIVLAAIAALPLITSTFVSRRDLMLLAGSGTVSLGIWLATYDSYLLRPLGVNPWLVLPIIVAGGLVPFVKWFDSLRARLMPIALILLATLVVAAQVLLPGSMAKGNLALLSNLFLGTGSWGFLVVFLIAVFAVNGYRSRSAEYKQLAKLVLTLVLAFLIAKMLDGGQSGKPDLGRVGWSDSLNRMWLHLLPLLAVTAIVGLVERHASLLKKKQN